MKKKILTVLFLLTMTLTACGGNSGDPIQETSEEQEAKEKEEKERQEELELINRRYTELQDLINNYEKKHRVKQKVYFSPFYEFLDRM